MCKLAEKGRSNIADVNLKNCLICYETFQLITDTKIKRKHVYKLILIEVVYHMYLTSCIGKVLYCRSICFVIYKIKFFLTNIFIMSTTLTTVSNRWAIILHTKLLLLHALLVRTPLPNELKDTWKGSIFHWTRFLLLHTRSMYVVYGRCMVWNSIEAIEISLLRYALNRIVYAMRIIDVKIGLYNTYLLLDGNLQRRIQIFYFCRVQHCK